MKTVNKLVGRSKNVPPRLKMVLIVCVLAAMCLVTTYAVVRASANYSITIDAIAGAGGASASGSYREPDSAMGQSIASGDCTSGSYAERAGVVMFWGGTPTDTPTQTPPLTGVESWNLY